MEEKLLKLKPRETCQYVLKRIISIRV